MQGHLLHVVLGMLLMAFAFGVSMQACANHACLQKNTTFLQDAEYSRALDTFVKGAVATYSKQSACSSAITAVAAVIMPASVALRSYAPCISGHTMLGLELCKTMHRYRLRRCAPEGLRDKRGVSSSSAF